MLVIESNCHLITCYAIVYCIHIICLYWVFLFTHMQLEVLWIWLSGNGRRVLCNMFVRNDVRNASKHELVTWSWLYNCKHNSTITHTFLNNKGENILL